MAKAIITIEDLDIETGTFKSSVVIEGTKLDDGYVTATNFVAMHIKDCLSDPVFLAAVWAKAEAILKENPGGTILNADQKIAAPANDEADSAAA